MAEEKSTFGSRLGVILAAAGSAVGLGNVWRFPTEVGQGGGAAFILIYIFFMLVLGVPVMISELAIGRHGQKNVSHSFFTMSGNSRPWAYMGWYPVIAGILVLSYYAVVAGWTLEYAYQAAINGFAGKSAQQYAADFGAFSSDVFSPILYLAFILVLTAVIVAMGVQKGIERAAKLMMPVLFLCIAVLVVCSFSLPGVERGLTFLLKPDFSKVDSSTVLSAMGQAFFSLSVGICCLCTYGCYARKDVNLMKDSIHVASIDTLVAVMSGLIIFPAVYSIDGLEPNAGPSLVFITLPNVFQQVFADMPVLAYGFSLLFYILLVMAALTSSISMLEMSASIFIRKFNMSRPLACGMIVLVCMVLGAACSLSFGVWQDITVCGLGIFDLFDFAVAKLLMPIGAFLICGFVAWRVEEKTLRNELTNNGTIPQPFYPIYRLIVKYVAPICILTIFLRELGVM